MLSLGTAGNDSDFDEEVALKMMLLLQDHGWDYTYGRDPLLILIEIEEYLETNGDLE